MQKKITCIICPVGCEITVTGTKDTIEKIEGNQCKRGIKYVTDEYFDPKRILTTTIKIENYKLPVISVRSDKSISKKLIFKCMELIKKTCIKTPVGMKEVVIKNILDTGADIITTKTTEL
ncbi:molybdopterin oxidoreductase [Tepidanaerobacter syntrophicus]|uniref:DUF1667 domain-containing protein n=1 Tax=Tepidanaerobacter syntrophicus TaxID=224999 RepID=UPI0022EEDD80|nr:DUF1667 domain-containing protein [Tepidanaerobacter syntrophicus]GLI51866.1 molybdopterin oxidoreductase [Tepidanaerobacter syntrophicus]